MSMDAIELATRLLGIMERPILDPFTGSGTIGVACAELGLDYTGIEVEPAYFEIACRRLHCRKQANDVLDLIFATRHAPLWPSGPGVPSGNLRRPFQIAFLPVFLIFLVRSESSYSASNGAAYPSIPTVACG